MDTRVQDLIEDYMKHYQVGFEEAVGMMIDDLNDALMAGERTTLAD